MSAPEFKPSTYRMDRHAVFEACSQLVSLNVSGSKNFFSRDLQDALRRMISQAIAEYGDNPEAADALASFRASEEPLLDMGPVIKGLLIETQQLKIVTRLPWLVMYQLTPPVLSLVDDLLTNPILLSLRLLAPETICDLFPPQGHTSATPSIEKTELFRLLCLISTLASSKRDIPTLMLHDDYKNADPSVTYPLPILGGRVFPMEVGPITTPSHVELIIPKLLSVVKTPGHLFYPTIVKDLYGFYRLYSQLFDLLDATLSNEQQRIQVFGVSDQQELYQVNGLAHTCLDWDLLLNGSPDLGTRFSCALADIPRQEVDISLRTTQGNFPVGAMALVDLPPEAATIIHAIDLITLFFCVHFSLGVKPPKDQSTQ